MKRRTLFMGAALAAVGAGAQSKPLRLGLSPFLSPAALLETFRPFSQHLQRSLGESVETYTARDFVSLLQNVQAGEYELVVLPAHMARLAIDDWRWQPMARISDVITVLVVVRNAGSVREPGDLRGRPIGMLDRISLTAAVGTRWSTEQGLSESDIVVMPSINSALIALERDELAAVVATTGQIATLPPGLQSAQRTLARIERIPGATYLARPDIDAASVARWREALLSFTPDPARPRSTGNERLVAFNPSDLEGIEPYTAYLRRRLAAR